MPAKKKRKASEAEVKGGDDDTPGKAAIDEADPNPFRLFVGGMPYDDDGEQLIKDFDECGVVVDFKLMMDFHTGKSKGIAFITFADEAGFKAGLKYEGREYAGRNLNVVKAKSDGGKNKGKGKGKGKDGKGKGKGKPAELGPKPAGCTSVVVKGLSYEVTEDDLQEVFQKCGQGPTNIKVFLDSYTGASKGLAFVDFDDTDAVDEAMKLTETPLKGRRFFMDYSNR